MGVIRPIPTPDANDPRDPLCYRGLCLISIPCKVYADIMKVRFSQWVDESKVVIDEQNGFRRNRSCLEHIYPRYAVINKRKQQKQSTFVCFVDAKKAFDTVHRDCLWYKLMSPGIKGKILKAVQYRRDFPPKFYVSVLVFVFLKFAIYFRKICHCSM